MDNFRFSVFDTLAYALPGVAVIATLSVLFAPSVRTVTDFAQLLQGITVGGGIIVIVAGYILGNVIDMPGSWIYKNIGCRLFGNGKAPHSKKELGLSTNQQRILIRQHSPANANNFQNWKVMKTMSHNLCFASLLLALIAFIQLVTTASLGWLSLMIIAVVSSILFIKRAYIFDSWYYNGVADTVETLNLKDKK